MPTDPHDLRGDAPLLDAWLRFHESPPTPFTIPGHKSRHDLVGDVVAGDVPLHAGLDTMALSHGRLREAEARAAALWGADVAHLSVGGSTHGNQALALAVTRPGEPVVVSRTLHRSMLLGLVLSGADPVWVSPDVDPATGLTSGISPAALREALDQAPDATAVVLTDPSYIGTGSDLSALAEIVHAHGRGAGGARSHGGGEGRAGGIPLVIDAAWAAHYGFHDDLPENALAAGADALVTSAHKTLPAWSQGALVLARTARIDRTRLAAAVEATQTTSPAGAILASIDASRALLERDRALGSPLLGGLLRRVAELRARLRREVPGLAVLEGPRVDPAKLTLVLPGTGADGRVVEAGLLQRGMPVELADRDTLVAMLTLADDETTAGLLGDALVVEIRAAAGPARPVVAGAVWSLRPEQVMTPRAAFFAERKAMPMERAEGRVCAELIAPYPPGIPVLAPGERITAAALGALRSARVAGTRIAYAADPTLASLLTVVPRT